MRAKVLDTVHRFDGYYDHDGLCRVRVWSGEGHEPVVVLTELPENPSTSVTNLAEHLWPEVLARYLPGWLEQAEYAWLIEHYPGPPNRSGGRERSRFDRATFASWTPRIGRDHGRPRVTFGEPAWRPLARAELVALIGEEGLEGERVE